MQTIKKFFWKDIFLFAPKYYITHPWYIIAHIWRSMKFGIPNLIYWFPIIWTDRYWDQVYLYYILHRKIEQMRRGHEKNHYIERSPEIVKEMESCLSILEEIVNNSLEMDAGIEKKYWEMFCHELKDHAVDWND